jgi:hypothetical protein
MPALLSRFIFLSGWKGTASCTVPAPSRLRRYVVALDEDFLVPGRSGGQPRSGSAEAPPWNVLHDKSLGGKQ